MDKEIKMKLLEELMDEMDGSIAGQMKPKEDVSVTSIETEEMPIEDVKEMIMEKMGSGDDESDEDETVGEMDLSGEDSDFDDDEGEAKYLAGETIGEMSEDDDEVAEGDIPYQGGRLAEKLKALRKLKG